MQIVRIQHEGKPRYAALRPDGTAQLWSDAPWFSGHATEFSLPAKGIERLVPVDPSKIVCVGRNYSAHARELGNAVPDEPLLFLKPKSALCAPAGNIVRPAASQRVEYEAELGVVIGKRLKDASPDEVMASLAGITCVNDVTARDIQRKETQFTRAKSFDTFCPVGPHVETVLPDLTNLRVMARVNGIERQNGHTGDMVFPVAQLIAFISRMMTLEPGDLISTGTPEGVGELVANDHVEIEVEGVGILRNFVV